MDRESPLKRAGRAVVRRWKAFAHFLGRIQTAVVLTLLYAILLPVFSLLRLRDPLRKRLAARGSYWEEMEPVDTTVEEAQRRY